jgi:cytidylate kinase
MAVITFSSSFGSGGSVVASRVADTLGWDLHNAGIPSEVAARLKLPVDATLSSDEASETRLGRVLARLTAQLPAESTVHIPGEVFVGQDSFKDHSESVIRKLALDSNCVIVGRAAAIVIGDSKAALHVRLDGNPELRAAQGAAALNLSIEESTKRLAETDRARKLYVQHFYRRDWADPRLYHLVLDSTALSLETCVELVLVAARERMAVH